MTEPAQHPSPTLSVAEILKLVNQPALEEMAVIDDVFYNSRFRSFQAFTWHNKMLLTEIAKLPAAQSYHEIGGGAGILPMGLGLLGYHAVNIDHYEPRVSCGKKILARLAKVEPQLPSRVTMVLGKLPEAAAAFDTSNACAITTNFAGTLVTESWSDAVISDFFENVHAHYGFYIFDACLLGGHHRERESWGRILNLAERAFGKTPTLFFDKGEYSRYYFVEF